MNGKDILMQLNDVDGDLIDEAANAKKEWRPWVKGILLAASVLLIASVGAVTWTTLNKTGKSRDYGLSDGAETTYQINLTDPIFITGEESRITFEEASLFLVSHKESIENELRASGVAADQISFASTGYSHVSTGASGNTLAVNWMDYLVYQDEKLVSIATVTKENGLLTYHLSFNGSWYGSYAELLAAHKGQELVYLFIGDVEALITPDNEIVSLAGADLSNLVESGKDYYSNFKMAENTYVP